MAAFFNLLMKFWALAVWWFIAAPWDRVLRVRFGGKLPKHIVEFGPGLHFRIPYVDVLYRQTVRLQFTTLDPQTVTTKDGQTITFAGVFGYVIEDLRTLYNTIQHADSTLQALVQGALAQYVYSHDYIECEPDIIEQAVLNEMDISDFGLGSPRLSLTTFARVRTYRLIMDEHAIYSSSPYTHGGEHSAANDTGGPA